MNYAVVRELLPGGRAAPAPLLWRCSGPLEVYETRAIDNRMCVPTSGPTMHNPSGATPFDRCRNRSPG